jgi:hypothetical protein
MRVLFFINHDGFIRNFEGFLDALGRRGDEVHIATTTRRVALMSEASSVEDLCRRYDTFSFERLPKDPDKETASVMRLLAASRSSLRFFGREYADAPKLRTRGESYVPPRMARFLSRPVIRSAPSRRILDRTFLSALDSLPTSPMMDEYIAKQRPDVVLLTPLILMRDVAQLSALRSAKRAGVPTALLVHSWDNLTNKGLIHEVPDRVVVWNEEQKQEAVDLHRVSAAQVAVTGAHSYDHWFAWNPSTTREEFCAQAGLDPSRPYVLYMCSSTFIAPEEVPFVQRWISGLRGSRHEEVRELGVLVRPHPQNTEQWEGITPADLQGGVVYPPTSAPQTGVESRASYYDSMYHSAAVMGINTTALIESAILERPVLTWLVPEFKDTQEGTLHFHYLGDGLLYKADTFDEHEEQLLNAVTSDEAAARSRRFVERFVRPRGIDVAATPILVDTVSDLADGKAAGAKRSFGKRITGILVWPLSRFIRARARRLAKGGLESTEARPAKPTKPTKPAKAMGPKALARQRERERAQLAASEAGERSKRDA